MGWNTDHHHCPWNTSTSAQPTADNPCITASPAQTLAQIQNETQRPAGAPLVFSLSTMFDPTLPGRPTRLAGSTPDGYYTPFLDTWIRGLILRITLWFTEYKKLGGKLGVMLLDFGACDYLNAGRMAGQQNDRNQSNFGVELVKMPQWPALRAELTAMGKPHGASFTDADMAEMKTWGAESDGLQTVPAPVKSICHQWTQKPG